MVMEIQTIVSTSREHVILLHQVYLPDTLSKGREELDSSFSTDENKPGFCLTAECRHSKRDVAQLKKTKSQADTIVLKEQAWYCIQPSPHTMMHLKFFLTTGGSRAATIAFTHVNIAMK
jgi:hypothetical protein